MSPADFECPDYTRPEKNDHLADNGLGMRYAELIVPTPNASIMLALDVWVPVKGRCSVPSILIRRLDAKVIERLKARANQNGRSLQAEVRMILQDAVPEQMTSEEARQMFVKSQEELRGRKFSDSADLIREDRER